MTLKHKVFRICHDKHRNRDQTTKQQQQQNLNKKKLKKKRFRIESNRASLRPNESNSSFRTNLVN